MSPPPPLNAMRLISCSFPVLENVYVLLFPDGASNQMFDLSEVSDLGKGNMNECA
ncbi:hypothetical protein SAMD00019534_089430 [Acytostelium subglobosum LB1]|uniref:hypothetical protein n=1 Tax=Acytostelium subglobosum LB1 TaxID=1410327 RepID=UPI000645032A|nr:hypothetical protein SAMD00019534_089430 [Acytostelium subglobosum LB1]GAM25768.1 hypothetical protein SAMD00019534_089430 [Acytostelium subglobosum LB1]|eukprot:XP_012751286.1 hypothetical protein SAMD00019534_089430 [Acytostelium subglobosum LB1]